MRTRSPVRVAMTCQRMPRWQKWAPRLASSGSWRTSTLGSSSPSRMTTLGKLRAAFPASSPSDRRRRLRSSWLFTSYLWKKKKQEPCPSAKPLLQVNVRGGLLISGTRCPYRHDLPRGHGVALRCRSLARIFHQLAGESGVQEPQPMPPVTITPIESATTERYRSENPLVVIAYRSGTRDRRGRICGHQNRLRS